MTETGRAPVRTADAPFALHAWVDESITVQSGLSPGIYVLAAVVLDPGHCDDIRDELKALRLRGQKRLHWRDENHLRRTKIAAAVATMDMAAIVTVGSPVTRRQERARRCCLERLVHELHQLEVSQVWVESRGDRQDKQDLSLVDAARSKGIIPPGFRLDFARPIEEPMLWVPDAVAGAVAAARLGTADWYQAMEQVVTQYEIHVP